MTNKYFYLTRPPAYAHQPDGYIKWESNYPDKNVMDGYDRPVWGWVEYEQPLSFYKAWKFDLVPDGNERQWLFELWLEHDRDVQKTLDFAEHYFKKGDQLLDYLDDYPSLIRWYDLAKQESFEDFSKRFLAEVGD